MSSPLPKTANRDREAFRGLLRRSLLSLLAWVVVVGLALFLPGGIEWRHGWLFFGAFLLTMALAVPYLWRRNPEIFVARSKIHHGTKPWDIVAICFTLSSFMAIFPVAGFDHRFQWSAVPLWLVLLGYVTWTTGLLGCVWVQAVNKFAEPSVRIQTDRGHAVVETGPYRHVRHPMYASSLLLVFGFGLALGSFWALVPAALASLALIVRTVFEDRTLQNELPGYRQYAERVRYRLVPFVW